MARVVGILLAAGAGTRMGRPKALVEDSEGPWLLRAAAALRAGGCEDVIVVIGAAAPEVRSLLGAMPVDVVEADDWSEGMAASLRTGLAGAEKGDADAALVHLVDLPDVGAEVVARVMADASSQALVRATFDGRPGHPVLIGREHWDDVMRDVSGDHGARDYLDRHDVVEVDCSDLASGRDVDRPPGSTNEAAT